MNYVCIYTHTHTLTLFFFKHMNFRILIQEFFKGKETVLFSNTKSQLIHFGSYFTELKNAERLPWWSNG